MKTHTMNHDDEMWMGIPGYETTYLVSNKGKIKSLRRKGACGGLLNPAFHQGYRRVNLTQNGKYKSFLVHRLVAQAFIPNTRNVKEVNHKNGIRADNSAENLEWVNMSENILHCYSSGLHPGQKNERNGNAKLKTGDVLKIRELYKTGLLQKDIAKMYGVVQVTISDIVIGRYWSSI